MPRLWFEIQTPERVRHLWPLGEHERPIDAVDLMAAARAQVDCPDDDVRDPDAWTLTVHMLHGEEELPASLRARCTVHQPPERTP